MLEARHGICITKSKYDRMSMWVQFPSYSETFTIRNNVHIQIRNQISNPYTKIVNSKISYAKIINEFRFIFKFKFRYKFARIRNLHLLRSRERKGNQARRHIGISRGKASAHSVTSVVSTVVTSRIILIVVTY